MHVILNFESGVPIYEQIKSQIRGQIISGELKSGEMLPSIRTLAKGLNIGVITAKRAYDDLCAEGFCYSMQGKGIYIANTADGIAAGYADNEIRCRIKSLVDYADSNSVGREKLKALFNEAVGE